MWRWTPLALLAPPGCAYVEETDQATLPAPGLRRVFGDVERGAVGYVGQRGSEVVELGIRRWAHGGSRRGAEAHLATLEWGVEVQGALLDLWARSPLLESGVDFAVFGPRAVDLEVVVVEGFAEVVDVRGDLVATAEQVSVARAEGSVDVVATAGPAQVEAFPAPGDRLRIEATGGDVALALPYGTPVDLRVDADPAWGVTVTDLGFDTFQADPGRVRAAAGDRSVPVEVVVDGGGFFLWEAPPPGETSR